MVVNQNAQRETGRKAQLGNITAAKAVSDIVRTTLGPRSMLKMLLDAQGSIVLTNDGNAILREIDVAHPAAKSMVDLSRAQDEEVGDGTTSVIILAGEMLHCAIPFLDKKLHPTVIIRGYLRALEDAIAICDELCYPIAEDDEQQLSNIVQACVGTKFTTRFGSLISDLAIQAVQTVRVELPGGGREIDVKKYAKVEKIPGGSLEDCRVLRACSSPRTSWRPGACPGRSSALAFSCWTAPSSTRRARTRPTWRSPRRRTGPLCSRRRRPGSRRAATTSSRPSPTW
jgi:T-complex protein 1 subunit gamma